MIEQHTPSSWSPNMASQYASTSAMRAAPQFPTTMAELAPAPQQQIQMQQMQQVQMQRSGSSGGMGPAMLPSSASQSTDSSNSGGFSAFQNYGLHIPFLSGDMGENSDSASLIEWCKMPNSSVTTLGGGGSGAAMASRRRCTLPQSSSTEDVPFFGMVRQLRQIVSIDGANKYAVRLFPQVDRGFFLADSEWTCYRRNYFQVSCTLGLVGERGPATDSECPCVVVDADGTARTAIRFLVAISAQVASTHDKDVELVQHTPKRDKGPQTTPQPQPIRCSSSSSSAISSSTVCFERLQFKTATANNGKRRAAQQYYMLVVDLLADCDDGERCLVASTASSPIVVRGRSPGHYADSVQAPARRGDVGPPSMPSMPSTSRLVSSYSTSALGQYGMPPPPHADVSAIRSQGDLLSTASSPSAFGANPAAAMAAAVAAAAAAASCGFGTDDVVSHVFPSIHQPPPPPPPPPPQTAAAAVAAAQNFALSPFDLHSMLPPHSTAPIQQNQGQHPVFFTNHVAAASASGANNGNVGMTHPSPPLLFAQQQQQHPLSTQTSVSSAYNPPYFPQATMGLKHPLGLRSASPASGHDPAIDSAAAGTPV
ncbi:hypothetical protein GGI20_003101 [Coemansia sp. BCRC 34301]|nr:hypothetical protein GGI20_003101 [Coemansia sp. BCRC 34301]